MVSDRHNYVTIRNADYLRQQQEELYAAEHAGFSPDLQREIDKLMWCDALILQFPLWWFGLPAILKGWVDRVFAMGVIYGSGRFYDRGVLRGRRDQLRRYGQRVLALDHAPTVSYPALDDYDETGVLKSEVRS